MSDVLGYARVRFFTGGSWRAHTLPAFDDEIERFHEVLGDLGRLIAEEDFVEFSSRELLQGPLADVMTHAGQLAMLRRLHGSPVPPENFIDAEVDAANLGRAQPEAAAADREWLDAEDEPW
ncbi:MAG: hypothetical protein ACR2GQ_02990 [Gemmatimonadota bacterium]